MKCQDIIHILNRQSPAEYALEWDNVGLLVGRKDKEVKRLLLAVDATAAVCQYAIDNGVDMIVTHHPMIFSKLRKINDDTVLGQKILSLAEAGVCCFAMHTNFDTIGGMAKVAAQMIKLKNAQVLEETVAGEGIGQIGLLDHSMTVAELAAYVKDTFDIPNVMVFGDVDRVVEKIAISPGSGKSVIDVSVAKGAECLVTGDIGHHEGLDAIEMGLTIIDASHYGVEKIFLQFMYDYLKDYCTDVEIVIADVGAPFTVI